MRKDSDFLGEVELEDSVYYGVQTLRAMRNFAVSGTSHYDVDGYIQSIALVKKAAAIANFRCGALSEDVCGAICKAADEIIAGGLSENFSIDAFQGGGGTSTNMNVNEVIACRANEIITGAKGYECVHPNDHVNMGQSTNDVIPAALKIVARGYLQNLLAALAGLEKSFAALQSKYQNAIRLGRTCLQDAVPMSFGQYFSGYVSFIKRAQDRARNLIDSCLELPLGATAVGTSLSVKEGYLDAIYTALGEITGAKFKREGNFFDGLQNADIYVEISAFFKSVAVFLSKVATDFRILSSGPRAGINELVLPSVQPGSSIMPGKVNPVIPELINQIAYQVCGNDVAIGMSVEGGELDLNVWEPVIIKNLSESQKLLKNSIAIFCEKCIDGVQINEVRCKEFAQNSTALSTIISSICGYKTATKIARYAYEKGVSVKTATVELGVLNQVQADEILDPFAMTDPALSDAIVKKFKGKI